MGHSEIKAFLTPRKAALMAALMSTLIISGAFFFQYVLGVLPCDLCYAQRVPHYVAIPLALLVASLPNRSKTIRIGLVFLALVFLFNAGLASYHAGVEWKLWAGPAGCSGDLNTTFGSAADLLSQMQQTKVVSCSEASWRFLGLSLAGWNVLMCLFLTAFVLLPFVKGRPENDNLC